VAFVAFNGTVAQKVISKINGGEKFIVSSSHKAINQLANSGKLDGYDKIIAMGLKNGSSDSFVHVEQNCLTKDGRLLLDTSIADGDLFQKTIISKNLENSWCNVLASQLRTCYPNKVVAFLHIPPQLNASKVANAISSKFQ